MIATTSSLLCKSFANAMIIHTKRLQLYMSAKLKLNYEFTSVLSKCTATDIVGVTQ